MLRIIDQYAFANRLRAVDPLQKTALAGLTILLCLALDRPLVGWLALGWMMAVTVWYAQVPLRVAGAVIGAESAFLALSVIGIAISVGNEPPATALWAIPFGPLWLSATGGSLQTALHVLSRALGSAAALNFLILTTPLIDLIELLRRLRAPALLIELMALSYRALFVLLDTLDQMVTAQTARLGYASWRATLRSSALLGSRLFIVAYQRSQALEVALTARGFAGELRVLPLSYTVDRQLWLIGVMIAASLVAARWWS
ncbi:cobalt ECF transporter T component CbiQ [Chloroflexus islandicus]|uniref:Cobalt ECF transporter T component CbiQ n=1 Tax=Chloroflexus islandicus TaxID=1707952 RepID=A0A178M8L3_9CHLR|nr:cobalt ECF transporter T component CbiQ [Chloroflexus islandicus]OAN44557.1 cobalt ECF transporter T component CbiQ [Chloroflexus islandicus]